VARQHQENRNSFEVESGKGFVRGDLARAVVEAGWDLNELRPTAMSLEEIFLQLTGAQADGKEGSPKESQ
jgi:ABC-2 type transport system ATP-binding protein